MRAGLFAYFMVNIVSVVQRTSVQVINSSYKRNLSFDTTAINLDKENFDMGLYISYFGEDPTVQNEIDTYFTAKFYQAFFQDDPSTQGSLLDWKSQELETEICKEGRFIGENETAKVINITGNFLCLKDDFKLKLQGSTSSETAHLIYISITNNQMIKYAFNYAQTQDSWLANAYDNKNLTYFSARSDYSQIGTRSIEADWSLFSVEIDLDSDYIITNRKVMTILDAFSNVGGLMGIVFAMTGFMIKGIQEQLFLQSIIKRIFLFRDSGKKKDQGTKTKGSDKLLKTIKMGNQDDDSIGSSQGVQSSLSISYADMFSIKTSIETVESKIQQNKQKISGQKSWKQHLSDQIFASLRSLSSFNYSLWEDYWFKCRKSINKCLIRKSLKDKFLTKNTLFLKAKNNIKREFDDDLKSKHSDPEFNNKDLKSVRDLGDDQLMIYISELVLRGDDDKNKIDKRILKNLTDDFQRLATLTKATADDSYSTSNKIGISAKRIFRQQFQSRLESEWKV
ncbi:UNKNOWN [Stylonychia lemnae]|uniref:Uncharacterized protein n=1 Tax=Stylonychia lemnae TaxID=5949 RepID=A0A078B1H3_STYLE|nr:UNKNOWN [Stylonychia lemnae]|eukprot:CDW88410.1 UNKNOWN [Stylonychia lemnae]